MNVVPRAAQRAQARAEAVQAEINKQFAAAPDPVPTAPLAAPAPPPDPPEVTPPAPEPPQAPKQDDWEQKYRSLQGVFNAEVPRLQQMVKDQQHRMSELLEARMIEAAKANEQPKVPPAKDIEDFGADLVHMVARQAEEAVSRAAAQMEARLVKLEQNLAGTTQTVAVTTERAFFDEIARAVPDWESINGNQAFLAWLRESDPIYGLPRQAALENAQKILDAKRCITIFQAWKAQQANVEQKRNDSLAQQVAPSASAAAPQPTPSTTEYLAYADVMKFYDDVAHRRYRGREKEQAEIEARINKAMAENRIR